MLPRWMTSVRSARFTTPPRRARFRRKFGVEPLETRELLSTVFNVTSLSDTPAGTADVAGTLRYAIDQANALAPNTPVTIDFSIGTGQQTISLLQPLPTLANPITIDGTTQPGYAGKPLIQVDGTQAGAGAIGFSLDDDSHNSTIKGLEVTGFSGGGILDDNGNANVFTNDVIGLHVVTNLPRVAPNGTFGIEIRDQANGNTISNVVVAGNQYNGIVINNSMNNTVTASDIGTDATGEDSLDRNGVALGNGVSGGGGSGIVVNGGAVRNTISNNVIVNNQSYGIYITDFGTSQNVVVGNRIGIDKAGTTALGNVLDGVALVSGASGNFIGQAGNGNVISGNAQSGIWINGADSVGDRTSFNTLAGNLIGTNAAGSGAVPNAVDGVLVNGGAIENSIGSPATGTGTVFQTGGNVISGNAQWGVYISDSGTTSNTVQNDDIGTDVTGESPVPNTDNGLDIVFGAQSNTVGGTTAASRNLISGNLHEGVLIGFAGTANNVVEGNFIGTDATGKAFLANTQQIDGVYVGLGAGSNTIGGQNPVGAFNTAAWNVISGNAASGILVTDSGTTGTVISGNFIGTDLTGTMALPNGGNGVTIAAGTSNTTIGAETTGIGNLNIISGNLGDGISITGASGTNVSFNYIGVDLNNKAPLPNRGNGVSIHGASGNRVNLDVIKNNAGFGILTDGGANHNAWYYDSIYANALGGIAQLTNSSPQPAPVLSAASVTSGQTTITGTITGSPNQNAALTIQFYASPAPTTPASIQGLTYIGQATATTNASGNASFTATLNTAVPAGEIITATADYSVTNTSSFSDAVPIVPATASFLRQDTTTQGSWMGTYGSQGADVVDGGSSLPGYASITPAGEFNYNWGSSTSDPRALEVPGGSGRVAATWWSSTSFLVDVNLTDGQVHDLELYFLDWDQQGRSEQVTISDAGNGTVLSTQTISSFQSGVYLDYKVSGNIMITITNQGPRNAVLSGLFLDPATTQTTPAITWTNPANIVYGTPLSSTQLDATASVPGTFTYTPAAGTILGAGTDTLSVTFTPTDTADYTTATAAATIVVAQATPGVVWNNPASIVYGTPLSSAQLDATASVPGTFTYTPAAGTVLGVGNNQTLSVTFTPTDSADYKSTNATTTINVLPNSTSSSATFLKQDTTAQGNWIGTYGAQGYDIINGASSLPSYATVTPSGQSSYSWGATPDVRGLQVPGGSGRFVGCWYSPTSFSVDVNLTDGQPHDLELYLVDWDSAGRSEQVQISDAVSGAVLSTQTISSFQSGVYLDYRVSGNIVITITNQGPLNAVLSGLFFN